MVICFNGIDGSGKTSQAVRLVEYLRAQGHPTTYVWAGGRTGLTLPFIRLSKYLLKAPKTIPTTAAASSKVTKQYKKYLSSTRRVLGRELIWKLWLRLSLLEHANKIQKMFRPHLDANHIIVCDRYVYDSVINTAFLVGLDPAELSPLFELESISRVPQPAKCFFLDVPAEVAYQRKDDIVTIQEIAPRVPLYQATAEALGMQVIDGTASPDEIAKIIQRSMEPLLAKKMAAAQSGHDARLRPFF